jgi:hypothetical protein
MSKFWMSQLLMSTDSTYKLVMEKISLEEYAPVMLANGKMLKQP